MRYPNLPHLTPDEFDALVRIMRSHRKNGVAISDESVAMARAVLLDGLTYTQAALANDKTNRGFAHYAVKTLIRHMAQDAPVRLYERFRGSKTGKTGALGERSCKYLNLPNLTLNEFEALVAIAQDKKDPRKRISDRSVAMARGVLIEGATYTEVGRAQDRPPSSAHQAVSVLLQYLNRILPVLPSGVFAKTTTRQD